MSDSEKRDVGKIINTWVQTIGIIVAAIWAYYSFVYEKISLPAAAPINTTLTLQVKKVDVHVAGTLALIPVEVRVTASNASSRTVHLLPTLWTASGQVLMANQADEGAMWSAIMKDANKGKGRFSYMYASLKSDSMVAGGNLFSDNFLRPGETISTTILVYVPVDKFDLIEVQTLIPTVTKREGIGLQWQLAEDKQENTRVMSPVLYRTRGDKQEPIARLPTGQFDAPGYEFQIASTSAQLSLWR